MARIAYVNGSYQPYASAAVHVEDRGFQFADGVYEVCEVRAGRLIDERLHMDRLIRSLTELRMALPMSRRALGVVMRETVRRNRVKDGLVYLQITRGASKRDFAFPGLDVGQTVVCLARSRSVAAGEAKAAKGIRVITMPDIRWRRPDIKTVALLPNALARQAAIDAGGDEAWLVDGNGYVTEGASCNAWIMSANGTIITRQPDTSILRGITRTVLIEVLRQEGLTLEERPFTVAEAKSAKEAFNSSATGLIMPVISVDGVSIGDGRPGPVAKRLRLRFHELAEWSHLRNLLT